MRFRFEPESVLNLIVDDSSSSESETDTREQQASWSSAVTQHHNHANGLLKSTCKCTDDTHH